MRTNRLARNLAKEVNNEFTRAVTEVMIRDNVPANYRDAMVSACYTGALGMLYLLSGALDSKGGTLVADIATEIGNDLESR